MPNNRIKIVKEVFKNQKEKRKPIPSLLKLDDDRLKFLTGDLKHSTITQEELDEVLESEFYVFPIKIYQKR